MAQAEPTENCYLQLPSDVDEIPHESDTLEAVEVNIALFGKAGTGRSSFINTIRGYRYSCYLVSIYNLKFILTYIVIEAYIEYVHV